MRTYVLAATTAALFVLPTAAFSQHVDVGPGGVRVGPGYHHRDYNRYEGNRYRMGPRYYNRYEGNRYGGPGHYHSEYNR